MAVDGYIGTPRFDRIFHLSGTRVFTADILASLPPIGELNAPPSGFVDHGTITGQTVQITVTVNKDSVDIGRNPTPARYYQTGQTGTVTGQMQEYQPEMISLAAGGDGVVGSGVETISGGQRVLLGGQLGTERRLLLVDDFDPEARNSSLEIWAQYWYWGRAQGGGSYTRAAEKLYWVLPFEYSLLAEDIANRNVLLQFYAIDAP